LPSLPKHCKKEQERDGHLFVNNNMFRAYRCILQHKKYVSVLTINAAPNLKYYFTFN
jgi:hypothetical protein